MMTGGSTISCRVYTLKIADHTYFIVLVQSAQTSLSEEMDADQIKFAAALTAGALDFNHMINTGALSQDTIKGQPLCMKQYDGLFGTCRIPGVTKDTIAQTRSRHIVVVSNNHFYQVNVLNDYEIPIPVDALYNHLEYVNQATKLPDSPVGLLTTENRDTCGREYGRLRANPTNQKTFDAINSAIFLLCLDSAPIINAAIHPAQNALLGGGSAYNSGNRWFYKTIQLFVGSDGKVGAVYDHTITDGGPRGRMLTHAFTHAKKHCSFNPNAEHLEDAAKPTKLTFQIDSVSHAAIASAGSHIDMYCKDVQLSTLRFENYGKNFLKVNGISPDGFIQMAIQLTNFRLFGRAMPSRETASLRQFRYGRTDFIRAVSEASDRFVRSMMVSPNNMTTLQFLTDAIKTHRQYTNFTKTGNGIDRHLSALKLMAIENGQPVPQFFQDPAYIKTQQFKTISSQITLNQVCGTFAAPKMENAYGVYYNVQDNHLFFTVSTYKPSNGVLADTYTAALESSLLDMSSVKRLRGS
ncbi:carnitine O-acetyltransferase-like [Amphiura filiformis]|uniref:carnitine O-acetyltransferase-like n=1 Tax=Amphiura filiformis TaxID=82378 RepID=UPI003B21598E